MHKTKRNKMRPGLLISTFYCISCGHNYQQAAEEFTTLGDCITCGTPNTALMFSIPRSRLDHPGLFDEIEKLRTAISPL